MSGRGEESLDRAVSRRIRISMDGRVYELVVRQPIVDATGAPRIVVPSYQPSDAATGVLQACVRTIRRYTPEPYELWIVDNNSPWSRAKRLLELPDANVVLNRTEPVPPAGRGPISKLRGLGRQTKWGSYANGIALELAVRLINPETTRLLVLHMDTAPCRSNWLSFLMSKIGDRTAAAGVRMDRKRTPEGVLHVLGMLVDFPLFKQLGLDFMPEMPRYDVGDRVTAGLRAAGYDVFGCANTIWQPDLVNRLPVDSPFRKLQVDRSFDDEGNVIFLHLGRGIRKSSAVDGEGTSHQEWLTFVEEHLLA